jgi:hypothetical protein
MRAPLYGERRELRYEPPATNAAKIMKGIEVETLTYWWEGPNPLAVEVAKPIRMVSIESFGPLNMPHLLTLWRPDGSGLRIHAEMRQIAEKMEIGVLCFEHSKSPSGNEVMLPIAPEFDQQLDAFKLVVHESGVTAESGILLRARNGSEIAIVAGAFPLTIAVKGVVEQPHIFEHEYPVEDYECLPIPAD